MEPELDPYYKRQLAYTFADQEYTFDTAALLDSAHEIAPAADVLLNALVPQVSKPPSHILDLGCGYGVMGLVLASYFTEAHVSLIDKDLIALRYAEFNRQANQLNNVTIVGSLGTRAVQEQQFDLIVSDLPTKIGDRAIEDDFFLGPLKLLKAGGSYWIVADTRINRLLPKLARQHSQKLYKVVKRQGVIVYKLLK